MSDVSHCPVCQSVNIYPDASLMVCADCAHEWSLESSISIEEEDESLVKDVNGHILKDGDSVVLIKDLKVKGISTVLKMGTKVKSIRLVGGDHEVDCKMEAGSFMLKACYLKKA